MTVKRLLSIDGGGIRGVIAAEVLVKMEEALKTYKNDPSYRLCDYFDFISGTSTGSIIAAGLATGMTARELLDIYKNKGQEIFSPATHTVEKLLDTFPIEEGWKRHLIILAINALGWFDLKNKLLNALLTKYSGSALEQELKRALGQVTLGSSDLKTNLMVVTNNVTRGETWFFVNNTVKGEYKEKNKYLDLHGDVPLWKIVRSSCAAPTFFPPYSFTVKVPKNDSQEIEEQQCEFIDGGISSYNNSSFQLFLEAVEPDYGTGWAYGADKLLLISIGTGFAYHKMNLGRAKNTNNAQWAGHVIGELMDNANLQQNQLMKSIGHQKFKDSAFNNTNFEIVPLGEELLTYCRFTVSFTVERLKELANKGLLKDKDGKLISADAITDELVDNLQEMDCVNEIDNLSAIGKAVAEEQFDISLLEGFL